jgi:hypothetical protein
MCVPTQIPQRNTSKTFPQKSQEKAPKITKKGKRERHQEHLRDRVKHLIDTMKDSYKV